MSFVVQELTVVNINCQMVEAILVFLFVIWLSIFFYFFIEPINDLHADSLFPAIHLILMHIKRTPAFLPPANIHVPSKMIDNRSKEIKLFSGRLKHTGKNGVLVPFDRDNLRAYSYLVVDFLDKQMELADLGGGGDLSIVEKAGGEGKVDGGGWARLDEQLFDKGDRGFECDEGRLGLG